MNDQVIEKGLSLVDKITDGLTAAAPQMIDITMMAIKFDAIFWIVVGFIFLFASSIGNYLAYKTWSWTIAHDRQSGDCFTMLSAMGHFFSCVLLIPALVNLINVYSWAALFDPRLSLALRVLDKVLAATNVK